MSVRDERTGLFTRKNFTLSNLFSLVRLSLFPLVVGTLLYREEFLVALLFYCLGAASDFLDGACARARKEVTDLGKGLDPLADKVFFLSTLVFLVGIPRQFSMAAGIFLLLLSEGALFAIGVREMRQREKRPMRGANRWGKAKAVCEICATLLFFLAKIWGIEISFWLFSFFIWAAVGAAVFSIRGYLKN